MEIEVKVLEVDRDRMLERLLKLGAKLEFDGIVESCYCRISENEILRIRKMGERCLVTYKKRFPDETYKKALEIEFFASDFENVKRLFEALGFRFTTHGKKHRTLLRFQKCEIAIDTVLHSDYAEKLRVRELPTYMEIEGTEEDIEKVVDLLGLDRGKIKPFSTGEVIEYYARRKF